MDLQTKIALRNRIEKLRKEETKAFARINTNTTEFERGRAFGEHEIIENEIFFLEKLTSEPVTRDLNDINLTK